MALHNIQGKEGEQEAAVWLEEHGFVILHRNWRCGRKELDIVAREGELLVVVEVKTRRNRLYGDPQDAVTEKKIRRIVASTDAYLRKYAIDAPVRFDLLTLVGKDGEYEIEHIPDAFLPPIW